MNDDLFLRVLDNDMLFVHIEAEVSQLHELRLSMAASEGLEAGCEVSTDGLLLKGARCGLGLVVGELD